MRNRASRREFVGAAALALAAGRGAGAAQSGHGVRLGVVGTGGRGTSLLDIAVLMPYVEITALCDVKKENLAKAQDVVASSGRPKPEGYIGEEEYRRLISREDVDAVLIATPWEWHTPMAVYSMKAGKYTGVEVPAAITMEQCWELIDTQEQTKAPCMMMENWSFRQDNLAVLNIIRAGLLGEINHCHCAHSNDCTDVWYFDQDGNPRWPAYYLMKRNADQYPTHSLGPVLSWMDLNCGDYPAYIVTVATRAISIPRHFTRKFGKDHPAANYRIAQADIVTSLVKTIRGNTIVINNDMQSPRPYDNRWEISGTDGVYNEQRNAIYVNGLSPAKDDRHEWEPFGPYQDKYDHAWYKSIKEVIGKLRTGRLAHGGPDYLEVQKFLEAARDKKPVPLDIYDSVLMSSVIPLSEQSLAKGSAPVSFPDFTRGKWKTRKPYFALES